MHRRATSALLAVAPVLELETDLATGHPEPQRPEEMEPTKKQRFCALVHGSARLDDHAIIGDVNT